MRHLYWHKPRRTVLGPKIEALSDNHPSKPKCLSEVSQLFGRVGNDAEQKRLLTYTLKLQRQRGDESRVAQTLRLLSGVNQNLGLHEEGVQQAEEAFKILERLGDTIGQAMCLNDLAWSLLSNNQLDAAENAAFRSIDLAPGKGQEHLVSKSHRVLGKIYQSKREKKKAIHHYETALEIASPFNWHDVPFWINYSLVELLLGEDKFNDANIHIERAKSHAVDNAYYSGRAMEIQARVWYRQGRFEDATSEALCALEVYEKLGAAKSARVCGALLREIEQAVGSQPTSVESGCIARGASSNALTNASFSRD